MEFFATNRFSHSFNKLLAKKKKYGCLSGHLFKAFYNKADQELFEIGFRLNGNHPVARLLKIRIKSCGGNAKSEGFRLIAFVNLKERCFYFLDIYPKTGPFAKSNMKQPERKECLNELLDEKKQNALLKVYFNQQKKSIQLS